MENKGETKLMRNFHYPEGFPDLNKTNGKQTGMTTGAKRLPAGTASAKKTVMRT